MRNRKTLLWILTIVLALTWTGCRKKTPEDLMEEAVLAYRNGDFMGATVKCRRIVEQTPDSPVANRARWILSDILAKNQDSDGAYDLMREICQRAGLAGGLGQDAFMRSVEILAASARFDEAIEQIVSTSSTLRVAKDLEEAQAIAAEKPDAAVTTPEFAARLALLLGDMYRASGNEAKAKAVFENMRETCTDDYFAVQAMERLIERLYRDEKLQDAIALYRDYLEKRPDSEMKPRILFGIGFFYNRLPREESDAAGKEADRKAAEEALAESVKMYKERVANTADENRKVALLTELTKVFNEMSKRGEAEAVLREHISALSTPRARSSLMLYAAQEIYFEANQFEKARELCAQVASEYPDTEAALAAHRTMAIINRAEALEAESAEADKATTDSAGETGDLSTAAEAETAAPAAPEATTETLAPAQTAPTGE